jgi:hypothetical protein
MPSILIINVLIAVIGLTFYLGYQYYNAPDQAMIQLPLVTHCGLHKQACSTTLPGGETITIEISPKNPSPNDVLDLTARFLQSKPQKITLRFKAVEMYMGYTEYMTYPLKEANKETKTVNDSFEFRGQGGVAVCITGLMEWHVIANVKMDGQVYEIPFLFDTFSAL